MIGIVTCSCDTVTDTHNLKRKGLFWLSVTVCGYLAPRWAQHGSSVWAEGKLLISWCPESREERREPERQIHKACQVSPRDLFFQPGCTSDPTIQSPFKSPASFHLRVLGVILDFMTVMLMRTKMYHSGTGSKESHRLVDLQKGKNPRPLGTPYTSFPSTGSKGNLCVAYIWSHWLLVPK